MASALIVAGGMTGANVSDAIYMLAAPDAAWKSAGALPHPAAFGVSVSIPDGLLCLGGMNAGQPTAETWLLRFENGAVISDPLPPMPAPMAHGCGALLGDNVYVASASNAPAADIPFWCFSIKTRTWSTLSPCPAPVRSNPIAGVQDNAFFLIGGLSAASPQTPLQDAWRFDPNAGWNRMADPPVPIAHAASPAPPAGQSHLLILGNPASGQQLLAYHTITNTWATLGEFSAPCTDSVTAYWNNQFVFPGAAQTSANTPSPVAALAIREEQGIFRSVDFAVLLFYMASQLLIGLYFARRNTSTQDFFLAGQRIPWWAAGLSIFGTQLSAITFMAVPAKAYASNWLYVMNSVGIFMIAPIIIYFYMPFYRRLNLTSAYEYLEARFNKAARLFGSTAYILMQLGRMSVVLFLPSVALATVTGLNVYTSILLMGVVTTIYTVFGGMEAVVWTDVVQVFVLAGGAIVALVFAIIHAGGPGDVIAMGIADGKMHMLECSWDYTQPAIWVMLLSWLSLLAPYTADQTIVQRYMTTKDDRQCIRSIWTNALLSIPSTVIFFSLGTALYCFYKSHPAHLSPTVKTDAILPWFVVQELPRGVPGLVVAGVFAASMSTLSSIMNSVATAVITDFLKPRAPQTSDRAWLACARVLTLVLGAAVTLISIIMAGYEIGSMWDQWNKIMGLFGASLAALFALGIFTRRTSGTGAIIGVFISVALLYWIQAHTHIHFFLYGAIGLVSCFITGYAASLIFPRGQKNLKGLTLYDPE